MCGIAGFYEQVGDTASALQKKIQALTDRIAHRGPDADGFWVDEKAGIALGHRRLSILDLSANGAQPMTSPSGRYVMIYNGEIYNHLEIRKDFEKSKHKFKGTSDTETFLAALDRDGFEQAIKQSNGMFAIAIWDREERKLMLARDRMGKKPLYVGWVGDSLVFSSELKAVRAYPDMRPEISLIALKAYIRFGYVPAPYCIYNGFISLPPGSMMVINHTNFEARAKLSSLIQIYWNCISVAEENIRKAEPISEGEAITQLERELMRAVKDRMISDVPLGAFLSGGVDSSIVVALMQKLSKERVKTYTIGFHEDGFDEAQYARQIALHLGTEHHEQYLTGKDALDIVPHLATMYDEPFSDMSQIPTYLVSKFAREQVIVALSGDGGDELFGGYNRHIAGPGLWQNMQWIPSQFRNYLGTQIGGMGATFWQKVRPQAPQFGERMMKVGRAFSARSEEELYYQFLSQWISPDDLLQSDVSDPAMGQLDSRHYVFEDDHSFTETMMMLDTLHYLPNDVLTKVDRATMATSLEARAPFLDYKLYELAWRLPQNMKARGKTGKWLVRQVLYRHVPRTLVDRPKMGFTVPIAEWLRGDLRDWAEDLLEPQRMKNQGYLNPVPVAQAWQDLQAGRASNGYRLWTILMLQAWLKEWM